MRVRVIYEFIGFPADIASIITGYCAEPVLLDWIPKDKLDKHMLATNPMAYRAGMVDVNDPTMFEWIAGNSAAEAEIRANPIDYFCSDRIWFNPSVADLLLKARRQCDIWFFSRNTCIDVVHYLETRFGLTDLEGFSMNESAITWLRAHPDVIEKSYICGNPAAIDIIQALPKIEYNYLSANSHPWAIEQLRTHQNEIDWTWFSGNPGIFQYKTDPKLITILTRSE
jgi:hypothetical protein